MGSSWSARRWPPSPAAGGSGGTGEGGALVSVWGFARFPGLQPPGSDLLEPGAPRGGKREGEGAE